MIYSEQQYKMLEQQLQKLKKENELKDKEIKNLKIQNKQKDEVIHDLDRYNYRGQCETLKLENKNLKKKLTQYEELLGIARISLEKNSSNSCKPSSTDGFKKVPQNNRIKSGKKPGRETGHVKSSPTVTNTPDETIKVSSVRTCTCGCHTAETEEVARDLVSIKIVTYTKQYVGKKTKCPCCNKEYMPKFPDNVKNPVNYDEKVKSLLVYTNVYCNVPNQKTSELLDFLTSKKIKISPATVLNTVAQFSKKSIPILKEMKEKILKEPVINEDETPINVNGKLMSTIGVFTNKISITEAFENRKLESFEKMGILNKYIGTVCHDHNNIHKAFVQSTQAECNFHILRYCKAEYEIHQWESIKEFMNFLLELRDKVDEYKLLGRIAFTEIEYEQAKKEYLNKLDAWDKEHTEKANKNKTEYYKGERNLRTRLRECVDDHLRFLTDFRIDFTNNLAERGLRIIKGKLKVAGCFRSLESAKHYCNALSIIGTSKKQNVDIGFAIESIFKGKKKIFAY